MPLYSRVYYFKYMQGTIIKTFSFSLLLLLISQGLLAQESRNPNNTLKVHATALAFRNYGLQYERSISAKKSILISFRAMTKGQLPLLGLAKSYIEDEQTFDDLRQIQVNGYAITPEFRFYLNRNEVPNTGFYLAPFVSYNLYQLSLNDFRFTVSESVPDGGALYSVDKFADVNGRVSGTTGGLLIGMQWNLGNSLYLDWSMLGLSYGVSNGELHARSRENLDREAQTALQQRLDTFLLKGFSLDTEVHSTGANADINGPWANLRMGLSIGFRF